MKAIFILIRHELKTLWISPATYIAAVLALLVMGFLYLATLFALVGDEQEALPPTIFLSTFWVPVLLVVPMLTMRSLAEERRLGTLESLMTTPVSAAAIVFSKWFGAYAFYVLVWLIALGFPLIASEILQQPEMTQRFFDQGSLVGGYLFIALSGALFIAVGIFASSLTRSQLVAGMLSFSIIFLMIIGIAALRLIEAQSAEWDTFPIQWLDYLQIMEHFEDFSKGVVDTRPVVYYLSGTALILGISALIVESKA